MQEKERRRFFGVIAARERDVPKKIRLLQIKLQLNRRAAKHSERIGVSAPRYKKTLS